MVCVQRRIVFVSKYLNTSQYRCSYIHLCILLVRCRLDMVVKKEGAPEFRGELGKHVPGPSVINLLITASYIIVQTHVTLIL